MRSLYYLAMCFKTKGQLDMALDQLESAAEGMLTMDQTKKDIVYEMAVLCEMTGQAEKAAERFKSIYQIDIGYKDVAERVEKGYR